MARMITTPVTPTKRKAPRRTKLDALLTAAAKERSRVKTKSNATTPTSAQRRAERARVIKAKRLLEGARVIKAKRKATTPTTKKKAPAKKADPCDKDKRTIRQSKRQGGVDMFKCFKAGDTRPTYMDPRAAGTVFKRKTWVLKPDFRKRKVATKTTSRRTKTKSGLAPKKKAERRVYTSKASDPDRVRIRKNAAIRSPEEQRAIDAAIGSVARQPKRRPQSFAELRAAQSAPTNRFIPRNVQRSPYQNFLASL